MPQYCSYNREIKSKGSNIGNLVLNEGTPNISKLYSTTQNSNTNTSRVV